MGTKGTLLWIIMKATICPEGNAPKERKIRILRVTFMRDNLALSLISHSQGDF